MSAHSDRVKGHAKEAKGSLTGDERLRAEGRAQRLAGEERAAADDLAGRIGVMGHVRAGLRRARAGLLK